MLVFTQVAKTCIEDRNKKINAYENFLPIYKRMFIIKTTKNLNHKGN